MVSSWSEFCPFSENWLNLFSYSCVYFQKKYSNMYFHFDSNIINFVCLVQNAMFFQKCCIWVSSSCFWLFWSLFSHCRALFWPKICFFLVSFANFYHGIPDLLTLRMIFCFQVILTMNDCVVKAKEQIDDVDLYTKIHTRFGKIFRLKNVFIKYCPLTFVFLAFERIRCYCIFIILYPHHPQS